jgi:hypothetical protein
LGSANGAYRAVYQTDGNFVVYGNGKALWHTHTNGKASDVLIMQGDGNLVIYKGSAPVWNSRTAGRKNSHLIMQNDGNLVIYQGSVATWSTGTVQVSAPSLRPAPAVQILSPGNMTSNGNSRLVNNGDPLTGKAGDGLIGNNGSALSRARQAQSLHDGPRTVDQQMIIGAFQEALGRDPRPNELASWLKVPAADARLQDSNTLTNYLAGQLQRNSDERHATTTRAFRAVLQRDPSQKELAAWDQRLASGSWTYRRVTCTIAGRGACSKTPGTQG